MIHLPPCRRGTKRRLMSKRVQKTRWMMPLAAVLGVLILLFIGVKISTGIWNRYMDPDRTSSAEETMDYPTLPVITVNTDIEMTTKAPDTEDTAEETTTLAEQPGSSSDTEDATPDASGRVPDTEYTGELQVDYTRMPGKYILTNADFDIPAFKSPYDANGDGIDDQTQFVQGAKEFLSQKPQYKSTSYYQGGYAQPDAEGVIYGVCTDVIAAAMKAAGYDLKALIDTDIEKHPERYPYAMDNFDANINFRRVQNQYCFFKAHAQSLTIDPHDIKEWQPGDIVVTGDVAAAKAHICMVSTRRADDGVAYVLQLATTGQTLYEEDYLTTCQVNKPILAHFRYSGYNGE